MVVGLSDAIGVALIPRKLLSLYEEEENGSRPKWRHGCGFDTKKIFKLIWRRRRKRYKEEEKEDIRHKT